MRGAPRASQRQVVDAAGQGLAVGAGAEGAEEPVRAGRELLLEREEPAQRGEEGRVPEVPPLDPRPPSSATPASAARRNGTSVTTKP